MDTSVLSKFYPGRNCEFLASYDQMVLQAVRRLGGFYNAHAHLDRAETLDDGYLKHMGTTPIDASSAPLAVKQNMTGNLHDGTAYDPREMKERMTGVINRQIALGVTRLDTCIDATPDLPEGGLMAIRIALELKRKFRDRLNLRIAPNPIFGFFRDPRRLEVFRRAAKICDFLSLLPEKDGNENERGFRDHISVGLEIARKLGKEVQLHLDQANTPNERGTEALLDGLDWLKAPEIDGDEPAIKIIHMISPSAYPEDRFARLLDRLERHKVGIIVCPSAAVSMRQLRAYDAPTHNSIGRLPELIKRRIPVWIGTDNIGDLFVPQGDGDPLTEIKIGGHAVRLAHPSIWAKLATGTPLNAVDVNTVGRVLYEDQKANRLINQAWQPAYE